MLTTHKDASVMGIIFPNTYDNLVPQLVAERAMAAIPFAGRYRLIDFMLSSMTNAGIGNISLLTRKNYHSLMEHLGSGREWDLARKHGGLNIVPPFAERTVTKIYAGRMEALASILRFLEAQKEKYVHLYRVIRCDYYYDNYDIVKWSISGIKESDRTFCWTTDKKADIRCNLSPDSYELSVRLGSVIPLKEIGKNKMRVNLYVNGNFTDSAYINSDTNGNALYFDIEEQYIREGSNTITLESELWNASAVNPADMRNLGIPVESLEFVSK